MLPADGSMFTAENWRRHKSTRSKEHECALVHYHIRHDEQDRLFEYEISRDKSFEWDYDTKTEPRPALELRRYYTGRTSVLDRTELHVVSTHMQDALKSCIKGYPELDLYAKPIVITGSPRCLFFHFHKLQQYREDLEDSAAIGEINLLLEYIVYRFKGVEENFPGMLVQQIYPPVDPAVDWMHLWLFLQPGHLVHHVDYGNIPMLSRIEQISLCECDRKACMRNEFWRLILLNVFYTGNGEYSYRRSSVKITKFAGTRRLSKLKYVPVDHLANGDDIFARLLDRGKRYMSMSKPRNISYSAMGWVNMSTHTISSQHEMAALDFGEIEKLKGRFMLDRDMYIESTGGAAIRHHQYDEDDTHYDRDLLGENFSTVPKNEVDEQELSDLDISTCTYRVPAFSCRLQRWCVLNVHHIKDVEYSHTAYARLVFDKDKKKRIKDLVEAHFGHITKDFDDTIEGKGQGLAFLLHGVPGVGKTLTVEAVADALRQPLLRINNACLETPTTLTGSHLGDILQLAKKWEAIVLFEDVDHFLALRRSKNGERNSLFPGFLDLLDSYDGVIFLTTNQLHLLDAAVLSRIHERVHYPLLTQEAKRQIWAQLLDDLPKNKRGRDLDETASRKLSQYCLDGRQIKNCMRSAATLSGRHAKVPLSLEQLEQAAKSMMLPDPGLHTGEFDLSGSISEDEREEEMAKEREKEKNVEEQASGPRPHKRRRISSRAHGNVS